MRHLLTSATLLSAVVLAGCVTAPPPPPALFTYDRSDCGAEPNLAPAIGLTPEKEKVLYEVLTPIGPASGCLIRGGKPTPYVIYALPSDTGNKIFDVGAVIESARIFAPEVTTLNEKGASVRTFARDKYNYRGSLYSVQFEARPEERYILVTTDSELVGQRYDSIAISTNTTTISVGVAASNWTTGVDTRQLRMFSYDGVARASAFDKDAQKAR